MSDSGPGGPISGPMAAALARQRERCNALFQQARRNNPGLDPDLFSSVLAELGQPVVDGADAAGADPDAVTAAVYEALLALVGKGLAADLAVVGAWRGLLPALGAPLAADPPGVLGLVSNAAFNLAQTPGPRHEEWLTRMVEVAATDGLDTAVLRDAGVVAAWRSGLAHGREAGLAAARAIPAAVAARALGIPGGADVAETLARLESDRWAAVVPVAGTRMLRIVARVGAFRGFGGQFLRPPIVACIDGQLTVRVGDGSVELDEFWLLRADRFGATLVRQAPPTSAPSPPVPGLGLQADGTVSTVSTALSLPELAEPTSWAATADTLAVTTARSHAVVLVADAETEDATSAGAGAR